MSAKQFGTKVHARLKQLIDNQYDPNFRAEVSYAGEEEDVRLWRKGFEYVSSVLACASRQRCRLRLRHQDGDPRP